MANYQYYRQHAPSNWGTQAYRFSPPPEPSYVPQPQWGGADYYRAHADGQDSSMFDYVWNKMKHTFTGGGGMGRSEAKHYHKHVYGGLTDVTTMLPSEIGAAAGYEALRFWEHHKSVYRQPLMDDKDREREALVGLSTGEAGKLWAYTMRPRDKYGKREAAEVAAATAVKIFDEKYDNDDRYDDYEMYGSQSNSRQRRRSFGGRYPSPAVEDDYYGGVPISGGGGATLPMVVPGSSSSHHHRRRASSSAYNNGSRPNLSGLNLPPGTYIAHPGGSALSTSPGMSSSLMPIGGQHSHRHHRSSSHSSYGQPSSGAYIPAGGIPAYGYESANRLYPGQPGAGMGLPQYESSGRRSRHQPGYTASPGYRYI